MSPVQPPSSARVDELASPSELFELARLIDDVFGAPVPNAVDMRGSLLAGGLCSGIRDGERLVAGLWSFAAHDPDGVRAHHSHIVAVRASHRRRGLGERIKRHHAAWCRARGVERIHWTFDPLRAGNARFNLGRLGAVGVAWIEDCYGALDGKLDPPARGGGAAPSDRMLVTWSTGDGPPMLEGADRRVPIPPTGDAPGAVAIADGLARLRAELAPLLASGGQVVGAERDGERTVYLVRGGAR